MFVRWQKRESTYWENMPPTMYAILVESYRENGKPRSRHIAYLGSIKSWEGEFDEFNVDNFWFYAREKLDNIGITGETREKVETSIAKVVPWKEPKKELSSAERKKKLRELEKMLRG